MSRSRKLILGLLPLSTAALVAAGGLPAPVLAAATPAAVAVTSSAAVVVATQEVALNANNCLEAFVRGPGGTVWHASENEPGTNWGDWSSVGGAADTVPVVATNADKRLEVFVTAADGSVRSLAPTTKPAACGTTWNRSRWVSRGGKLTGQPAVATNSDGRLEVFGVGSDGSLRTVSQTVPGSVYGEKWGRWKRLGTPSGVTLTGLPAVGMNADGRLQVFLRGSDQQVWTRAQHTAGSRVWDRWTMLKGLNSVQSAPTVAANADGRLQVFAAATDQAVRFTTQSSAGSRTWGSWQSLGGKVTGNPKVAMNASGRLEVFALAPDKTLRHWIQIQPGSANAWGKELNLLGRLGGGALGVVANSDGRLEAFGLRKDGTLWHRAQNVPGASAGSDWNTWGNLSYGADPCVENGSLACVNVLNVSSALALTPKAGDPNGYVGGLSVTKKGNQRWSLARNGDGTFQIVNRATGKCLDVAQNGYLVDQWACQGQATQRWYLEPSTATKSGQQYLIRQVATGHCLSMLKVGTYIQAVAAGCGQNQDPQQWQVGISGNAPGAMDLAIQYGFTQCAQSSTSPTCSFALDTANEPAAYLDQHFCLPHSLVRNDTAGEVHADLSFTDTNGWENTVGGSISLEHELDIIVAHVTVAVEASYEHTWIGSQETGTVFRVPLKPGEYGWLEKDLVAKKAIGTWHFNGNSTWTQSGQSAIHAVSGTDNQTESALSAHSSMTPPANC